MIVHICLTIYGEYGLFTERGMEHPALSAPCCLKGTRLDFHHSVLVAPLSSQYQYYVVDDCLLRTTVYDCHI